MLLVVEEAPTPVAICFVFIAALADEGVEEQLREAEVDEETLMHVFCWRRRPSRNSSSRRSPTIASACCRRRPSANLATYVDARYGSSFFLLMY